MGLYLNVIPGLVKVRVTKRGTRVGVGPRWLRFWGGTGGEGVSTGVGPVGYYHPIRHQGARKPVPRWHGQLPDGWQCSHNHRSQETAVECARSEARRRTRA